MTNANFLEDFALIVAAPFNDPKEDSDQAAEIRLAGFDAGYEAGFDDAKRLHLTEKTEVEAKLVECFERLNAGLAGAQVALVTSLAGPLTAVIGKLLPEMAQLSALDQIREVVEREIGGSLNTQVALRANPTVIDILSQSIPNEILEKVPLSPDPNLSTVEAELDLGGRSEFIDLSTAQKEILELVQAAFLIHESPEVYS